LLWEKSAAKVSLTSQLSFVLEYSMSAQSSSPFRLDGRVALVTGSSKGLGKAIAIGLGKAGAKVAMNYNNSKAAADKAFAEFKAAGCEGAMFKGNVIDQADVERMVEEIRKTLGPLDIIVLNATPDQPQKPIEQYDWDFYQSMLDFFIKSPYLLTRAALPHMKQQRWGRIINITSEVFQLGVSPFTAYVAAKGGQTGFSRSLARELAPFGITVNMIAPGWIPVERHENDPQEMKDAYLATVPAARWGVPEDVIGAAVYFASEAASFVTGQTISVTGGHTVH
jgi:3-oxoacyl-[acyl-carrier protein] reductase